MQMQQYMTNSSDTHLIFSSVTSKRYYFVSYDKERLPFGTTVQHWQLRDMIKATETGVIYIENQKACMHYDFKTKEKKVLIDDLCFGPTALAYYKGNTLLAGQKGQILLQTKSKKYGHITTPYKSINNAVHFHEFNKQIFFGICNNEGILRFFKNNTEGELIDQYKLPFPINNYQISPDGEFLICVGDTPHVYVLKRNSDKFKAISRLHLESQDSAFKIDFDSMGNRMIIGTQNGYAYVFDMKSYDIIGSFRSKRNGSNSSIGAIRSVEFSKNGCVDLLLFAEHSSYFNIVDTRSLAKIQNISINSENDDRIINGAMFTFDGTSVIVSSEDVSYKYDIDLRARRGSCSGGYI